jgi:hypothetical protein
LSNSNLLAAEKQHLAGLLEAIQRCVYFLNASSQTLSWPLQGEHLLAHKKTTICLSLLQPSMSDLPNCKTHLARPCVTA